MARRLSMRLTLNTPRGLVAVGLAAVLFGAPACANTDQPGGGGDQSKDKGFKIGLLLPESKTTRYESFDRPLIEKKLKRLCAKCEVLYQNADQDPNKQQSQAESMLTQGAKVLILDAVDAKAAGGIVSQAKEQGVPVVAYDRLASGPVDNYVSYDNRTVGEVQGKALLDAVGDAKAGKVVMINGAPTDPNAADFKAGAHSVLDDKVKIGKEYDTPQWSPDNAQREMEQAITALGKDKIVGVYAANDGTAGGAISAMKGAELAAIQRILAGEQTLTVYKALKPEAEQAAQLAYDLLQGKAPTGTTGT